MVVSHTIASVSTLVTVLGPYSSQKMHGMGLQVGATDAEVKASDSFESFQKGRGPDIDPK